MDQSNHEIEHKGGFSEVGCFNHVLDTFTCVVHEGVAYFQYRATDYYASRCGKILSLKTSKPRVLKPGFAGAGYQQVVFSENGSPTSHYVHRVVGEVFHGVCPEGLWVDHIDADKMNNSASNLEYVTPQENLRRARRLSDEEIKEVYRRYHSELDTTQTQLAAEYGITTAFVWLIVNANYYADITEDLRYLADKGGE